MHSARAIETRRKGISVHAMLHQPQMKASDEHIAGIHSQRWWDLNYRCDCGL
jgi:hypothetical protein